MSSEYQTPTDDDYVSRPGQADTVPVQKDDAPVQDPIDAETANSDETLAADEKEAIDQDNVIEDRTRGAAPKGGYKDPGDDEVSLILYSC